MLKKIGICMVMFVFLSNFSSVDIVSACPITRGTINYLPTYAEFSHYTGKWKYSGEIEVVCAGTTEPVEQKIFVEHKLDENGYAVDVYRLSYSCH